MDEVEIISLMTLFQWTTKLLQDIISFWGSKRVQRNMFNKLFFAVDEIVRRSNLNSLRTFYALFASLLE